MPAQDKSAPEGGGGLRATVIADPARLDQVEGAWRRLAELRGNAFVTPEWFRAWHGVYGTDVDPAVAVARDGEGTVRGILPFVLDRRGLSGRLRFAGAGLGDHFDPAAAAEDVRASVVAAAVELGSATPWSTLVLDNVEAGARWPSDLLEASPRRLVSRSYRRAVLPRIDLRELDAWDDYLLTRSRNLRSQLRRFERAVVRDHAASFRRTERADELDRDLATFFRLHDARWDPRGGSSSQGVPVREFHRRFAAAALSRGWLRLWFLELDHRPVAGWYGWSLGGRYAYYLAGFDPAFARLRVGHVLLAHTIRDAIESGAEEYDLLLGDESYKSRFASSRREVETLVITPAAHPARAVAALETGLWRAVQRLTVERRGRLRRALAVIADRLPGSRSR